MELLLSFFYHRRSSRKAWPHQRLIRARQLSFRLAPRAGDGSDPAFSHLCLLPAPLTGGPAPLVRDWAVNTRCGRRLGSSDGSGARWLSQAL